MKIDVEELMRETKILYWREDEIIYQENHIGIQGNIKNKENTDRPLVLELIQR